MTARRSAPRESGGGEGSSKEAGKGGGIGGGIGGGKAADEVASRASATPGRIIVPDAPTIIRPAMDPTLLPGEPADDGFLALPPDRLRLAALRERFYYPPANWHVEQHSDRVLLPGVAVSIDRGALDGVGLIAENIALRVVRFEANGDITDLDLFEVGGVPGALGVQP